MLENEFLKRAWRDTARRRSETTSSSRPVGLLVAEGFRPCSTRAPSPVEPWLTRLDDAASEMRYAAALIETWLRGGLEIGVRRRRVKPGDIAVLYPRRRPDATDG